MSDKLQQKDGDALVGGGNGITPTMSLTMELCKKRRFLPITLI